MKTALITGASGELGRAISLQVCEDHNVHLLIHYNSNQEEAEKLKESILKKGYSCDIICFDITNKADVDESLNSWIKRNQDKTISIIVNNAGIKDDKLLMWMDEQSWKNVIDVSLNGMYNVTSTLIRPLLQNRWGRVVNIVSLSGLKGVAGQVNYSAAKGGVIAATKALAQEVAKRNITVNAVAPGFIRSKMTDDQDNDQYKSLIPMNRFGDPEEVAHLVSFLVSEKASYITGEVININGGVYS